MLNWVLVSEDTLATAFVSENLAFKAEVHPGDTAYTIEVSSAQGSWSMGIQWRPETDIQLADDGSLVLTQGKRMSVYRDAKLSWSTDIGNALPLVLGEYVLLLSNQGIVLYFTSGLKSVGEYELVSPLDISESAVAGIWNGKLRLYRDKKKEWALPYEYPRFTEICKKGVAVAFPRNLVFYDFSGNKLWDKELPVSTSALHCGGGLIWIAGTNPDSRKAELWAFSDDGSERAHFTYDNPKEPAFVSRIFCDGETLRVFVSRVLYTYKTQ
ncbi:MAG: hypothetical protein ABIM88_01205 [candidate division WOR-3 bacterium]